MRYIVRNGESQFGPFSADEIKELFDTGAISLSSFAAPEGTQDFLPLSEMGLISSGSATAGMVSSFSNQTTSNNQTTSGFFTPSSQDFSYQSNYQSNYQGSTFNPVGVHKEPSSYVGIGSAVVVDSGMQIHSSYHRTSVISKSFEILMENLLVWVLIELVPIIVNVIFFISLFGPLLSGAKGDFNVSSSHLIQTVILGLVSSYLTMTSFIMIIDGAANLYDGMVLSIGDMFIQAQKKLPIFVAVMIGLSTILSLPFLLVYIFPENMKTFVTVISYTISGCILFKLFPLPISVVVEDWDLSETLRIGFTITKGHFLRFFGIVVAIVIMQMLPLGGIYGFGLKTIYNVNSIIMLTVLYKSMMDEALALGKI